MQLAFPQDPRFSAENFDRCPFVFVTQALEAIEERDLNQALLMAYAPAEAAWVTAAVNTKDGGRNLSHDTFNPVLRIVKQKQIKERIPTEVAQMIMTLNREGLVPGWALQGLNLDEIKMAAN